MFKKCVIFIFLATAYTVLLAHSFTPHQHETKQATHHHEHDHNHDDHDDDEKNPFHYFQHIGESVIEYTSGQLPKYEVKKKGFETGFKPFCKAPFNSTACTSGTSFYPKNTALLFSAESSPCFYRLIYFRASNFLPTFIYLIFKFFNNEKIIAISKHYHIYVRNFMQQRINC
jgi:hypothetical protein